MSIESLITMHRGSGELRLVTPYVSSDRILRNLLLTRELFDEVYKEKESSSKIEMFAKLKADLEVFVTSEAIDSKYLWCLNPRKNGIWEIRSTRPRPQIRVFGAFAAKDNFIGTHYALRKELGSKESEQWKIQIKRFKAIWRRLFPAYTQLITEDKNQLFSGALNEKYLK